MKVCADIGGGGGGVTGGTFSNFVGHLPPDLFKVDPALKLLH